MPTRSNLPKKGTPSSPGKEHTDEQVAVPTADTDLAFGNAMEPAVGTTQMALMTGANEGAPKKQTEEEEVPGTGIDLKGKGSQKGEDEDEDLEEEEMDGPMECDACKGTGEDAEGDPCLTCKGKGVIRQSSDGGPGSGPQGGGQPQSGVTRKVPTGKQAARNTHTMEKAMAMAKAGSFEFIENPRLGPNLVRLKNFSGKRVEKTIVIKGPNDTSDSITSCPNCGGTGKCPECEGAGKILDGKEKVKCDACDTSGKCDKCMGAGEIKKDHMDNRLHYDSMPLTPMFMIKPFERTIDGFLTGRAVVTNVGVFEYKDPINGSVLKELRLPEEIFNFQTLDSLKMKPMTNNHPAGMVKPENAKALQVGSTGSNPSKGYEQYGMDNRDGIMGDGYRCAIDLTITDGAAIEDVLAGKRALSCGYNCDLEKAEPGARWMGMPYDFIQRNIRYNHVAIVDTARAGDDAVIHLDAADSDALVQIQNSFMEEPMKVVKLDGVDYQAEAKVIETMVTAQNEATRLDGINKDLTTQIEVLTAERDTAKDQVTKLDGEVTKLTAEKMDQKAIDEAVTRKLGLLDIAHSLKLDSVKVDTPESDIKKQVILSVFPEAKLDGKSEEYLTSRFDAAVEMIGTKKDALKNAAFNGDGLPAGDGEAPKNVFVADSGAADSARQKMIDEQKANSRK